MNRKNIVPMACCLVLLGGCATSQPKDATSLNIKPSVSVRSASNTASAMYQLGRYYQGQNRYDRAIDAYQKALALDAGHAEAHNGLGVAYSMQGKYNEAIDVFKAALAHTPQAAHIHSNLGYVHYLNGDFSSAIVSLKHASVLDPDNPKTLSNLELVYTRMGEANNAMQAHEKAKSAEQSNVIKITQHRPAILPIEESRVKLVQLSSNIYELKDLRMPESVPVRTATDGPSPEKPKVEVSNGNGVTGMAKSVGHYLRGAGYPPARLTNQKSFQVQTTKIQYREGYEAAAKRLRDSLPVNATLERSNDLRVDIKIRIVLGKDIASHQNYFSAKKEIR